MWQETARRDRYLKLSPSFLLICVILNVKVVNCFIYKETNCHIQIELDQISLLFAVACQRHNGVLVYKFHEAVLHLFSEIC